MLANAFYRLAGKQINELVKPYGFKKRGRYFYRITSEGVVQQFCLLWLHQAFTIRFYLSSIYGANSHIIEGSEIYELINGSNNQWLSDDFADDEMDLNSLINSAADICLQAVQTILLPFLDSHKDPQSAKAYIVKSDPHILSGTVKYDTRELGFFLAMGDMTSAQNFLLYYIDNCESFNKNWWISIEGEYRSLLNAIRTEDRAFISDYMEKKKSTTYREYKWKA